MSARPSPRPEAGYKPPATLHHLLERPGSHSAARLVGAPTPVHFVAKGLAVVLPLLGALLLIMPWQQAALGTGRVIAYQLEARQQTVEAPVKGTIDRWYVQEGQRVRAGDLLVALRDNDPRLLERLEKTRDAGQSQVSTLADQVRSYEAKLDAEKAGRDLKVAEARSKVAGLQGKRVGLASAAEVEALQAERLATLAAEGIESQRKAELGRMKAAKASAELAAMDQQILAAQQAMATAGANGDAKVAAVQAELESARAKLTAQEQKQIDLDVKVSRQEAQLVRAPRDGRVLRLHGGPGGVQVKEGDLLVTFVPESDEQAAELWVDGNDMPLVREGEQVRLLFEGWPALQVVGFPGADAGTYAGRVTFVDAADDGKGHFRIVVQPDPEEHAWPDPDRLRQGVRVKGWVLLGQVSLGYELWRRINGFPSLPPVEKGDKVVLPSGKKPKAPADLQ